MHEILKKLKEEKVLIFDGGMGTMLQNEGLNVSEECPEAWNTARPDIVRSVHKGYFDAGCGMVETNTFGGNRFRLADFNQADKVYEYNRAGAELAREAAAPGRFVAGSVGPSGKFLLPHGDVTYEELYDAFKEQVLALAAGGVDAICVETMSDLKEAEAGVRAAKDHCDLPVFASMIFTKGPKGYRTMMGVSPEQAVKRLLEIGADVVGSNCGNGPDEMLEVVREMRDATQEGFLLAKPNAGMPELADGNIIYPETPEVFAGKMAKILEAGVNIIGGCCGTTPAHLARIAKLKG